MPRILSIIAYYKGPAGAKQTEQYESMLADTEQVSHDLITGTIECQLIHLDHVMHGLKLYKSSCKITDSARYPGIVPRPTPSL